MAPRRFVLLGTLAAVDLIILAVSLFFVLRSGRAVDIGGLALLGLLLVVLPAGLLVWLFRNVADGDGGRAAPLAAAPGGPAERMTTLEDLRALGLLTEDEYRQKREEILGAL